MRGAWTIALREIVERRVLLLAALVAGLFPFASPLFPGVRAGDWNEARDLSALIVSVLFGVGCAILLGATVIGRDLAERRLSFDFSRPVGSGGIWAGRLGGALGLSVLALGVALLPATAVGGGLVSASNGTTIRGLALAAVAAMVVVIPLAHVAGVALRSRSAWLAVDVAAAGVVVLVVGATGRILYNAFALQLLTEALIGLGLLAVLGLWVASVSQVVVGRIDPRRGHAAQACTLWGILLCLAMVFAGFIAWVVAASPRDLGWVFAQPAPRGPWVAVTGAARARGDYMPGFLINSATGRYVRLAASPASEDSPPRLPIVFSRDGRRAVVFRQESPRDRRTQVSVVDLDAGASRESNIVFPDGRRKVAVSDHGDRLAVLGEGTLSIIDLDTGATLAAARATANWTRGLLWFVSPDRVRLVTLGEHASIDELSVTSRKLERHTDIADWGDAIGVEWDAPRDRYLVTRRRPGEPALLADGRTGQPIRELACATPDGCTWRFLADGRIVVTEHGSNAAAIGLLSIDGDEVGRVKPPTPRHASFVRELEPGRLLVRLDPAKGFSHDDIGSYVVDLATGSWNALPGDLYPSLDRFGSSFSALPEPGSVTAHLFLSAFDGSLILYDPERRSRQVVAGRGVMGSRLSGAP
jgi:hypothetical protein